MSIAFQGSAFFPKTKIDSKRNIELKKIIDSELLLNPELVVSQLAIKLGCAEHLTNSDYDVNGICIIITDGEDNASVMTANSIKKLIEDSKREEKIQALTTVLVGIGVNSNYLLRLKNEVNFDQYINMPDASPKNFAKLVEFIKSSVSSVSSSINQGKSALIQAPVF